MRRTDVRTAITPILPGTLTCSKNQWSGSPWPRLAWPEPGHQPDRRHPSGARAARARECAEV